MTQKGMVISFFKFESNNCDDKIFCVHFSHFRVNHQKLLNNPEMTEVQEVSCFVKYVPLGMRQRLPWMTFLAVGLWGLTSDTVLSFYDVVSDYLLAKEHFE